MNMLKNWNDIKDLFSESFKSCFHYAIATVDENGNPLVTPIGLLILTSPGHGFYFEQFMRQMSHNMSYKKHVCVFGNFLLAGFFIELRRQ